MASKKNEKRLDDASRNQADREKQRRRDFKKGVDRALLQSAFNTATKREYNKTHKNQIP